MPEKYILYFDDTGSRAPDRNACIPRHDKMDCFGLGGLLVKEEDNEASPQQAAGYQEENLLMMRNHGFSNSSL